MLFHCVPPEEVIDGAGPSSAIGNMLALRRKNSAVAHAGKHPNWLVNRLETGEERTSPKAWLWVDQTEANSITNQTGCLMDFKFPHEASAMRGRSFHTDSEKGGYLLCCLPLRHQLKHLTFS